MTPGWYAWPCPNCGSVYGDHDLEHLVDCFEEFASVIFSEFEIGELMDDLPPTRGLETVEGATYQRVLGSPRKDTP